MEIGFEIRILMTAVSIFYGIPTHTYIHTYVSRTWIIINEIIS